MRPYRQSQQGRGLPPFTPPLPLPATPPPSAASEPGRGLDGAASTPREDNTRILCASDWNIPGGTPIACARKLLQVAYEVHAEEVFLLGGMWDGLSVSPEVAVEQAADWFDLFGPGGNGYLTRLAQIIPVHLLVSPTEEFLLRPDYAHLAKALSPIRIVPVRGPWVYEPQDGQRVALLTHGRQPGFNPLSDTTIGQGAHALGQGLKHKARKVWEAVSGRVRAPQGKWRVSDALAATAARIRAAAAHEQAELVRGGAAFSVTCVVHGGTEPYWGQFCRLWAGCPGPRYAVLVDTYVPNAGRLVELES